MNITEIEMSPFWQNIHYWLHQKLSKWQLLVQPVMKMSSKWHFHFSDGQISHYLTTIIHNKHKLGTADINSKVILLSGEPDYFGRNKISSGGDLSHYSSASLY